MARFLFVVPPLVGHTNPTIPLGRELTRRGHAVAWTGHPEVIADLVPDDLTFIPVADAMPDDVVAAVERRLTKSTGGIGGFSTLWNDCVLPIAHQMLPGVRAAVDDFGADALVVDQHALAGAAVAEERGLPWATSATSSADLVDPLDGLPKVSAWLHEQMSAVLVAAGVDPPRAEAVDPRFSPHLVLAFTTRDLVGPTVAASGNCTFVGPSFDERPDDTDFPWDWLDGAKRNVLVTLGTLNWQTGGRFFAVAAEAFASYAAGEARAVFVAPADLVPDPPPNVLVAPRVPQLALLPHLDAVVCHGGHNTVCESLAHGVPLVVAAVRDDQPIVADQVVRSGAGVRVKFTRVTGPALREAVDTVLDDPSYRTAAERVQASFAASDGPAGAADRLEALVVDVPARSTSTKGP